MRDCLKLLRVKHYIKNLLILLPLFFGKAIFDVNRLQSAVFGILSFCMISSAVYILNDMRDVEKDRKHPIKKNRPIASGRVSHQTAWFLWGGVILLSFIFTLLTGKVAGFFFVLGYFILNVAYSFGLKNVPIIDIMILAAGFVIRMLYGGFLTDIEISGWLYLVVVTGSLYMGLGKRRNELLRQQDTREVLKYYTEAFLDKNMYVCVALVDVFYALWSMELGNPKMKWTIPIFIAIMMLYSLDIEGDSDGDPVEVILSDRILLSLVVLCALIIFTFLYWF